MGSVVTDRSMSETNISELTAAVTSLIRSGSHAEGRGVIGVVSASGLLGYSGIRSAVRQRSENLRDSKSTEYR